MKLHIAVRCFHKEYIDVPVVFMARDVMILMQANPFQGPLEGVGPENRDFLVP
jgi:hypothetical protein